MKINEENYLIELCKKNEKALEYIIDKYSAIVNGVVRKVLLPLENNGLIEECISDIFFSVWNNIGKFSGEGEGTINTKVNRARKRLRAKYTTLEEVENYE